jgi:DNA-binding CsgD family transcriptional regulator
MRAVCAVSFEFVLYGRGEECARVAHLLDAATRGEAQSLAFVGEAGSGKTALLDEARAQATGFTQLRMVGIEAAGELAYVGLGELLSPHEDLFAELVESQRRSLRGALGLSGDAVVQLAVHAAVSTLFGLLSDRAPVLCTVDDAHWVDAASIDALLFATRRLETERVAVLLGARTEWRRDLVARGVPVQDVRELGREDARLLVAACGVVDQAHADAVLREANGNPLALIELSHASREGFPSEDGTGRLRVDDVVAKRFLAEIQLLPEPTRQALEVVAACDTDDERVVLAAVDHAFGEQSLEPAYVRVLRCESGTIRFRHPLMRSAVYQASPPAQRRAAHAAIAAVLNEQPDRRAWHWALSVRGRDEAVATALEQTAGTARRRGGLAAEARAMAKAAALSENPGAESRRWMAAGSAAVLAGRHDEAREFLDQAELVNPGDVTVLADVAFERARLSLWHEQADDPRIMDSARMVAADDPLRAARLVSYRIVGLLADFDAQQAAMLADEAWSLMAGRPEPLDAAFKVALAWSAAGHTDRGLELADQCSRIAAECDDATSLVQLGHLFSWAERDQVALSLLDRGIQLCRTSEATWMLVNGLLHRSCLYTHSGRPLLALADAAEAQWLAGQLEVRTQQLACLATLALAEAAVGRLADAESHAVETIRRSAQMRFGAREFEVAARAALASIAMVRGTSDIAFSELAQVRDVLRAGRFAEMGACVLLGELPEAAARAGRVEQAKELVEEIEDFAVPRNRRNLLAASARARAVVDPADGAAHVRATEMAESAGNPVSVARARLAYGEFLRRNKRILDARVELAAARESFTVNGADAWAERAAAELRAAGVAVPRTDPAVQQLTPMELEIATLVAAGSRNREIAGQLYVSEKTVEAHLGKVYRKLGLRSRTQVAEALARHATSIGKSPIPTPLVRP